MSEEDFNNLFTKIPMFKVLDKNYNHLKSLEMINAKEIATTFGYDESIISSDSEYVISNMNNIRTNISNTEFVGNLGSIAINGSNPVLSLENQLSFNYFSTSSSILEKIAAETQTIVNISLLIDQLDNNLSDEANLLLLSNNNKYNIPGTLNYKLHNGYSLDLSRYNENPSNGFELFLSNETYSIEDFDTEYAKNGDTIKKKPLMHLLQYLLKNQTKHLMEYCQLLQLH